MKYGCGIISIDEMIIKYAVKNKKIIVYYYERTEEFPYSREKEMEIISIMLEQAIKRNNLVNIDERNLKQIIHIASTSLGGFSVLILVFCIICGNVTSKGGAITITTILAILSSLLGTLTNIEKEENDELKKYRLYLENKEKFDKYNCALLTNFRGRKYSSVGPVQLNINTIDDFTLEEVEVMVQNLSLCEITVDARKKFQHLFTPSPEIEALLEEIEEEEKEGNQLKLAANNKK